MNTFRALVTSPLVEGLGWGLLHFLWQGAVIAVLLAVVLWVLRNRSSNARYLAGWVALLAMVCAVPLTTWFAIASPVPAPTAKVSEEAAAVGEPPADTVPAPAAIDFVPKRPQQDRQEAVPPPTTDIAAEPVVESRPSAEVGLAARVSLALRPALPWLVGGWLVGALMIALWHVGGWCQLGRLRRAGTREAPDTARQMLSGLLERFAIRGPVKLLVSARVAVPTLIGWLWPVILLPASVLAELPAQHLELILAHELAHLRRCDYLLNLVQTAIETLLFYHPAVWWVSRQIRVERESCCDEQAAAVGDRLAYARALTSLAELCQKPCPAAPGLALGAGGGSFTTRIRRVLRLPVRDKIASPAWLGGGLAALLLIAAMAGAMAWAGDKAGKPADDGKPDVGAQTTETPPREMTTGAPNPLPPAGARVTLLLDHNRTEYLLGENITVCYRLENVGKEPIFYEPGAFYPGLRLNDAYRVTAVPVDESGKQIGKPLEPVAWPTNWIGKGGPVGRWSLEPGKVHEQILYLPRYVRLDKPGRYRIRIVNHARGDSGANRAFSVGETIITLKVPTPQQARAIYEEMKKLPPGAVARFGERREERIADFTSLTHPVYLPILLEYAQSGDTDALDGLGTMHTKRADEALITVLRRALDKDQVDFALAVYHYLTFSPESAAQLRRLASRLAHDREPKGLGEIAEIYRHVGTAEDMPDLTLGFSKAIEATKTLPFEKQQYFRPRGAVYSYQFAVPALIERGAKVPQNPQTPGEAAAYLLAMRQRKDFRPKDWPDQVVRWLGHETPYMREFVLEYLPEPAPDPALQMLPALLADPSWSKPATTSQYVDLQIAACRTAAKHPRKALREPLLNILKKATEKYLLAAAAAAGPANGITTDQIMEVWVARIDNSDLAGRAVVNLVLSILDDNWYTYNRGKLEPDVLPAAKARWSRFIREHREDLRKGRRYKIGDPEITPDLFPPGFQYYYQGKPWPPATIEPPPQDNITQAKSGGGRRTSQPAKETPAGGKEAVGGKSSDQPAAPADETTGIDGVQLRLHADKPAWPAGTIPAVRASLRHGGTRPNLVIVQGQRNFQIEVDGTWYLWPRDLSGGVEVPLQPGKQMADITVAISPLWEAAKVADLRWGFGRGSGWPINEDRPRLQLKPGKHRLRVACLVEPQHVDAGNGFRVVSNTVEIVVAGPAGSRPLDWPAGPELVKAVIKLYRQQSAMMQLFIPGKDASQLPKLLAGVRSGAQHLEKQAAGTPLQSAAAAFSKAVVALDDVVRRGGKPDKATLETSSRTAYRLIEVLAGEVVGGEGPPAPLKPAAKATEGESLSKDFQIGREIGDQALKILAPVQAQKLRKEITRQGP